jgi:hypothetical protein
MALLQPVRSPTRLSTSRRGLPSPPSSPMGSNASSVSRASVISAYHELYPSHVVMDNETRFSVVDADQQQPLHYRNHALAQSSPPSPPANSSYARLQNGISERQPSHVSRNRNQQHLYPEYQQPPHSNLASLTKSPSLQSNASSLPRGKPRIFAAMEAQESGRLRPFSHTSLPFSPQETQEIFQAPSPIDEYLTPKVQFETLPEIDSNGDVDFSSTAKAIDPHNVAPGLEPYAVQQGHSGKSSASRSAARQDDSRKQHIPPTPRAKKLSKARQPTESTTHAHTSSGSTSTLPGSPDGGQHKKLQKTQTKSRSETEPTLQLDEETIRNAGIPLDDDPFARAEGVKMLKPTSNTHKSSESLQEALGRSQQENLSQARLAPDAQRQTRKDKKAKPPVFLLDPTSKREPPEPTTMPRLLLHPQILANLLQFLSFYEWCTLLALSKEIRSAFVRNPALRESALERFLKTIGYCTLDLGWRTTVVVIAGGCKLCTFGV